MRKSFSLALALVLGAILLPAAFAQDPSTQTTPPDATQATPQGAQQSPSQPSQQPSGSDQMSQGDSQNAFTGTIVKAGDKFVLKTDTASYQLDDQMRAKKYANKQVTLSGTLDNSTGIIHVTDIQAMTTSPQ